MYVKIPLTQGHVTYVSAKDYVKVSKYSWYVHFSAGVGRKKGKPYARGRVDGKNVYLHRFLMKPTCLTLHVDHINKNTLDNRRENLEIVTHQENCKRRDDNDRQEKCKTESSS